ncbi:hypothetical protein N7513_001841 [Penicillium frequentans]|nr:hypothetical protein N7513_001841 [Penicillium glabrum]
MDESWPEPPIDQNDHEPRAHAKNLLKTTKQWKKPAGEGGLPSLERFVQLLDALCRPPPSPLARPSLAVQDSHRIATREALASHVTSSQSSLVSEWLTRAKTNGTVPSNDLSSGSSAVAVPSLLMREDLQLLVRGTARTLVDPLRRDEAELVRRIKRPSRPMSKIWSSPRARTCLFRSSSPQWRCTAPGGQPRSDGGSAANQVILRGLTVYGRGHDCQLFEGSQHLQQCFHCQGYGHIARFCKRETRCGYCAESHDTQDCTHPHDRQRAKCGPCVKAGKTKVNHFTSDRECPVRKEQIALLELNPLKGSQLHQPRFADIPFQKPPSTDHDHPLPSESAGAQAQAQAHALQPHRKGTGGKSASRSRSAFKKRRTVTIDEDEGTEAMDEDLRALIGTTVEPIEIVNAVQDQTNLLDKPQSTEDQPQPIEAAVLKELEFERSSRNDQC